MAGLLTAIVLGYVGPVTGYLDQRAELREERAKLADLEARRDVFREQIAQLGQAPVLEARARELGLVMPGERAFLVRGDLDPAPPAPPAADDDGRPLGWFSGLFSDRDAVAALIGREPFTHFSVALRCPHGGPAIVRNEPLDRGGRPFPTRDWLACRALGEAVSRLEAAGGVRALEEDPAMAGALDEAHSRHQELHAGHRVAGCGDPRRVKCLHAHLAFGLAEGGSPIAGWIMERAGAAWPERCCLERLTP